MKHAHETERGRFAEPMDGPGRWRTVLRTSQTDHAIELLQGVYTPHSLVLPRGGSLQFCYDEFELGSLHCARLQYGCEVVFSTSRPLDYLNLSVLSQGCAEIDGQVFSCGDTAALHEMDVPRMRLSADARVVNVRIQLSELWRMERLLHGGRSAPPESLRLRTWVAAEHPASRWLRSVSGFLAHAPSAGKGCDSLLVTRLREGLLMQLLSIWPREGGNRVDLRSPSRHLVQRAIDYIENAPESVDSLQVLVQVTGVSARSLHRAFVAHLGLPPMRYVLQRRLECARRMLQSPFGPPTIAEVAAAQGFHNFGEFAALYQRQFGELPRATRSR